MSDAPRDVRALRQKRRIELTWADDAIRRHSFFQLRCACPCAACVDENTGRRILDPATVPADVAITSMQLVGNYALKIVWSDGHSNGLYTWDQLRALPEDV